MEIRYGSKHTLKTGAHQAAPLTSQCARAHAHQAGLRRPSRIIPRGEFAAVACIIAAAAAVIPGVQVPEYVLGTATRRGREWREHGLVGGYLTRRSVRRNHLVQPARAHGGETEAMPEGIVTRVK